MNKKNKKPIVKKQSINRKSITVIIFILIFVLLIGWFIFQPLFKTTHSQELYDFIDHLSSALRIQSSADDYLNEIYEKDLKDVYESENTKVSVVRVDDKNFVNILSTKRDYLGDLRIGYFDRKNFQFDLLFKFGKMDENNDDQRFGIYFLQNSETMFLLGCNFDLLKESLLGLQYVGVDLKARNSGVQTSKIFSSNKIKVTANIIHRMNISTHGQQITLKFDENPPQIFPVPQQNGTWHPIFWSFVVNGNSMFRIENIVVDDKPVEEYFERVIDRLSFSNLVKFKENNKNEDFNFKPALQRYLYKMPIMNDYRNALVGLTPFTLEYPTGKLNVTDILRVGFGLLDQGWMNGIPVRFRIIIKNNTKNVTLFDETISPDMVPDHNEWQDRMIDLSKYGSSFYSIEFSAESTDPDQTASFAAWSAPVMIPKGYLKKQPNVLLISLDTVRWDRMSLMDYTRNTSSNIDKIAHEGAWFTQCISQASWTTPSHISIMTSQYPSIHGVLQRIGEQFRKLDPHKVTLAEVLRGKGYETVAFTGHAGAMYGNWGLFQGFYQYREYVDLYRSPNDIEIIVPRVIQWLKNFNAARPFFMFLHTFETHTPFTNTFYAGDSVNYLNEIQYTAHKSDLFDGDLHFTDEHIGTVFETLKDLGILDNTIVIITSDHGYVMPGEHGNYDGYGNNLYEGCVRVPLIIRYPAKIQSNTKIAAQVRLIDIAPTILDLSGYENHPEFQGISLLPLINGKQMDPIIAYAEAMSQGPERKMIRTELFKYIYVPEMLPDKIKELTDYGVSAEQRELYHLPDDPYENNNVSTKQPNVTASLQQLIDTFITAGLQDTSSGKNLIRLNPETLKKLRGLGYIK